MKCNLSEIMNIIGGGTPKTTKPEYWNGTIPWLSVKDFANSQRYVYTTEKCITEIGLLNSSANLLRKDDTIISARGTVGELAMIPFPMAFNQSCYGLRAKKDVVDPAFLYYLMRYHVGVLKKNTHGSVFDTITRDTFSNIEVEIPSLKLQKRIAAILSSLDDKIELNNKINANLEQQAQALYRLYFPYDVASELPEEWRVGTVGEIICLHDFKRIPLSSSERAKMKEKRFPYYGAASLMDYVEDYIFDGRYLLLGEDGTVVDEAGYPILQYVWGKFWVNNHAHVLTGKLGFNVESLYMLLRQTSVKSIVTGAVQSKISQSGLRSVAVVIPPEPLLVSFNTRVYSLFKLIRHNVSENIRLAMLRDILLPYLMSGQVEL